MGIYASVFNNDKYYDPVDWRKYKIWSNEEASRLDLVFTKEMDIIEGRNYQCPLGKSDHLLIEFSIGSDPIENRNEIYKNGRYEYRKVDFIGLREYFGEAKWKQLFRASSMQEKWDIFMEIYNEGVSRYVPKIKTKEVKRKKRLV